MTTDFGGPSNDQAKAVAIDSRDRIIAAGGTDGVAGTPPIDFALARYVGEAPPSVRILGPSHVKTRHRRARAHFELRADEPVTFHCRIDSRRFHGCSSPYKTPRLRAGKHRLKVRAIDEVGNRTAKVKRFAIVESRR